MAAVPVYFFLSLYLMALSLAETQNFSSSSRFFWAQARDEKEFPVTTKSTDPLWMNDNVEIQQGFPTIDSMLQWALSHSDPEKLKETAQGVQRLPPNELASRQRELKELMETLKMPSDAELMQIAIADLNNSSSSVEDRLRALNELLVLVEPIDNANDMDKLGGLTAVIGMLNSSELEIRGISAWVLGKASQNNPLVQEQILQHGALNLLMKMVKSNLMDESCKALYAVSAVIRNNPNGQLNFFAESGVMMLQEIMSNLSMDVRLHRKCVFLVADLAECHLYRGNMDLSSLSGHSFLKSVVDLIAVADLDLQEKALVAIKGLLQLSTTDAMVVRDFCRFDAVLEILKNQLHEVMLNEDQNAFAGDVEKLLKEVENIYHEKLEQSSMVPT